MRRKRPADDDSTSEDHRDAPFSSADVPSPHAAFPKERRPVQGDVRAHDSDAKIAWDEV